MKTRTVVLNGSDLTVSAVNAIVSDPLARVEISPAALEATLRSRQFLDQEFNEKIIYGVNTGFGPMASHIIGREEILELQRNLIRGHAMGMGEPLPSAYVLAAMVVRLNTLAKGYSGVSPELLQQLEYLINSRITPIVPEHGAVGTSGDLVQLAHIALAVIGEGEVMYQGKRRPTSAVFKELGIKPYSLKPKEGLSLINGTSMMTGIFALLCREAQRLISFSVRTGVLALELTGGFEDSISKALNALRPHPGQQAIAQSMRGLLASSAMLRDRDAFQKNREVTDSTHLIPDVVQEVYSLRCIPQILGPMFDTLQRAMREVTTEMNSVTDNPIIDVANGKFLHGGNFHGDYIAAAADQLKASIVKLTMLSERRINFFLNAKVNGKFPPFMNLKKPGLTMGLQGLQFVATSTTARSQTLAFPQHIHSIPTNGDNQDVVSMGTDAALLAAQVIENAFIVLTIEALTLAQGVVYSGAQANLSAASRDLVVAIHETIPPIYEDRSLAEALPRLTDLIRRYDFINIPW